MLFLAVTFGSIQTASAIGVGILPFDVAINQATNKVYVSHFDGSVHVFDTNGGLITIINDVSLQGPLFGMPVNPNTNKIYDANSAKKLAAVMSGS